MSKWTLLLLGFLFCKGTMAQIQSGGKLGLSLNLGSHYRKAGIMVSFYAFNNAAEVNSALYINLVGKNIGPRGKMLELVGLIGIQGHWGEARRKKFFFDEYCNMSPHAYSIGYTFYQFISGQGTSQSTGSIHVNIDAFQFALANDALGTNQVDDKFRTGGFSFSYQVDSVRYGIQNTLWTGKSSDAPQVSDPNYPSRDGYRDISKAMHGGLSHGILALRSDVILPYEQVGRLELGLDDERIRHLVQNEIMHDGFLPLFVRSENPHYPMLQNDGSSYTFGQGQKIRNTKPFLQVSANQPGFY